jgi:FkbM family methyltransferase
MNDELPEQIFITKYLTGNEKVLEIGGNVGRSSLVISSILREPRNLVTLECDLYTSEQLREHRDINNLTFHIEASALSKRKIIQKDWDTLCSDVLLDGYHSVSTITMDELNTKYMIDFDTLVLDCEGAFCNILRDMPEVLDNIKLIIMENDYKTRADYDYVHKTLVKHGFYVDFIDHGGGGSCYMNFYEVWKRVMV